MTPLFAAATFSAATAWSAVPDVSDYPLAATQISTVTFPEMPTIPKTTPVAPPKPKEYPLEDGDVDYLAISLGYDAGNPVEVFSSETIAFGETRWIGDYESTLGHTISLNVMFSIGHGDDGPFTAGLFLHPWYSIAGGHREKIETDAPSSWLASPMGLGVGAFFRLGGPISDGSPEIYPSIEVGAGIDPIRIIGGIFASDDPTLFPGGGAISGLGSGLMSGVEGRVDAGINFGPVGLRGGIYPSYLHGLNPGIRLEFTQ